MDSRGRRTIDDFLTLMAWHDDNHLEQIKMGGLEGPPKPPDARRRPGGAGTPLE